MEESPLSPSRCNHDQRLRKISALNLDIGEHLHAIYELAIHLKPRSIVDIGVGNGIGSTYALLYAMDRIPGSRMTSIDIKPAPPVLSEYKEMGFDCSRWAFKQGDSIETGQRWTESVDWIFLDTSHEEEATRNEIDVWSNKLTDGGVFLFHDSLMYEVFKPITDFITASKDRYDIFNYVHSAGLTIIRKNKSLPHFFLQNIDPLSGHHAFLGNARLYHMVGLEERAESFYKMAVEAMNGRSSPGELLKAYDEISLFYLTIEKPWLAEEYTIKAIEALRYRDYELIGHTLASRELGDLYRRLEAIYNKIGSQLRNLADYQASRCNIDIPAGINKAADLSVTIDIVKQLYLSEGPGLKEKIGELLWNSQKDRVACIAMERARYLYRQRDYSESAKIYRRLIELAIDNHIIYYNYASCCQLLERHDEAESYFRKVLEMEITDKGTYLAGAYFHLGEIKLAQNLYSEAEEYFCQCLFYNDTHVKARKYLEEIKR